ncbi:MAG: TetR/AcrR family transcriptional regulator [Acidobacteria bacterium]|nr:TetR/AcrR family transcriptional regulator [Acidobacteriota bacterium]
MPPPTRMAAPARREMILETAIRLFAERGFRGVTTRELAAEVGVTEPVLYQHFPSKRDLYHALIEHKMAKSQALYDQLDALFAIGAEDREFFQRLAHLIILWHESDPTFMRLLLQSGLEGHELREMFFERMSAKFLRRIADHIGDAISAGRLRAGDPQLVSYAFCSMIGHYALDRLLFPFRDLPGVSSPAASRDAVEQMVDLFLTGLEKR